MKTLPLFCFLTLMAGNAMAKEKVTYDDLLLEDGTTLKNVVVLKVEPDGLRLEHKDGVSKVKYQDLPELVQKKFAFDREKAEEFRLAQDSARENKAAEERKAHVEQILEERKDEQDGDFQRAREAFYTVVESDDYSYPQMDKALTDSIAIFTEAGRKDLASILEEDRKLLRDREVVRPGEKYRREREQLLARIRTLENEVADQHDETPVTQVVDSGFFPFFVDRPVIIDRPIAIPPPSCPPSVPCVPPRTGITTIPPRTGTVTVPPRTGTIPVTPRQVPAATPPPSISRPNPPSFTPSAPARPSMPAAPSQPSTTVSLPSSGVPVQVQGTHPSKK